MYEFETMILIIFKTGTARCEMSSISFVSDAIVVDVLLWLISTRKFVATLCVACQYDG